MNNEKLMNIAINESNKALKINEVPIGCVIIQNGKIIAKGYNKREKNNDLLGHAEIITIKRACKKLKTWKLDDCTLYVTLKPCSMCEAIIKQARIKKVYYLLDKLDFKKEFYKTQFEKLDIPNNYQKTISNFFENKRKNKKNMI